MAVTYAELVDQLNLVIGESHDGRLNEAAIVNQAGRYLVSMHPWRWRQRPSFTMDLVNGQSYLELPPDFNEGDEIVSVSMTDNVSYGVALTTQAEIDTLRANTILAPSFYYVAISFPNQKDLTSPQDRPRLELHPTPTADSADALRLSYRGGWTALSLPSNRANIPETFDFALIQCVRAFGAYYITNSYTHVDALVKSESIMSLKKSSGGAQANLGNMLGGIGGSTMDKSWNFTTAGPA
jgi:hypothetical protein